MPDTAADPYADWPRDVLDDMRANADSGLVGSVLVSETDRLRVWHLHLPAGQRCAFHRHVNPYFWTALTPGRARTYFSTGEVTEMDYTAGQTQHYHYDDGEFMLHSLENTGATDLTFVTVEHLDGPNRPLPVPDAARI